MPNRLAHEKSLYLRQHADNPVDWFPWGEEALEKARNENKPLLVSIGYSSCHWCHVMAHESFESVYIAELMNRHFVCIKVDREERPDLDRLYLEAVQMINGHGGWPLNVFCLPDGRPFAGGTYFPPEDRNQGIVPWPQLLMRVSDYFKRNRADLEENATAIIGNLKLANDPVGATGDGFENAALVEALQHLQPGYDKEYGGFGSAPKFPPTGLLEFLFSMRNTAAIDDRQPQLRQAIDQIVPHTLEAMARGGIYDQVGGGFCRYSVDRYWTIPHFEKMLYDNALLIQAYTEGWRRYRNPLFAAVVDETCQWLEREMMLQPGVFAASLDADSGGEEGSYYVWTPQQIEFVLANLPRKQTVDAEDFCRAYGVTEEGNFEHGTTQLTLVERDFDQRQLYENARRLLLEDRQSRVAPARDDKVLVSWNALLWKSLAEAAFTFGRWDWMNWAKAGVDWMWEHQMRDADSDTPRLYAVNYAGEARQNAFLDDYVAAVEALLAVASKVEWLETESADTYLYRAKRLTNSILKHFRDPNAVGYFFTSDDHEGIPHRAKEWFDTATPAGNSGLVSILSQLYTLTGDARYVQELERQRVCYTGLIDQAPQGVGHAMAHWAQDAVGIAVLKAGRGVNWEDVRLALETRPWRPLFLQTVEDLEGYQLCVGTQCLAPERDLDALVGKF
ncbi:MAG: thioredoxin domain-containing protein [Verrucomicrobiota bacterium JB022]|nr:thioredoxin domain-containing protein [Verrucomicrobiota bacterium JB022]